MSEIVGNIVDFPIGTLKLVRVDGRRICLVHLSTGVHALDNACPHEGYGLTTGYLNDGLLTCAWHNWKFDAATGACVQGEEDVAAHVVEVAADGSISVSLATADPHVERERRFASLRRGIADNYSGQIARDAVRLLQAHANPGELIYEAVAFGAPRGEWGWGHSVAVAADCLAIAGSGEFIGPERAFPVVHAIVGIAEESLGEEVRPLPDPLRDLPANPSSVFRSLVEREDIAGAQSFVLGALMNDAAPQDMHAWFLGSVADHHLSYGHAAIYTQKAFQLLELIGWDRAQTVLPHLVTGIVSGTREDLLPPMRPFMRALAAVDLTALAEAPVVASWSDGGRLLTAILDSSDRVAPLTCAIDELRAGAGVDGLLDVVVTAVSERMLRYNVATEDDLADDFNWLDITHGITYADAARWHHQRSPGPDSVRLALFCVFLAHWTGRHEWHAGIGERRALALPSGLLLDEGCRLQRQALLGPGAGFLVQAHAIKTAVAATNEAVRSRNSLPLQAVERYLAEKDRRRYVAATVQQSIDFVTGRAPRE